MYPVFIRKDSSKPHINANDAEVITQGSRDGSNIRICNQLVNSPDLNILYVEYFKEI